MLRVLWFALASRAENAGARRGKQDEVCDAADTTLRSLEEAMMTILGLEGSCSDGGRSRRCSMRAKKRTDCQEQLSNTSHSKTEQNFHDN